MINSSRRGAYWGVLSEHTVPSPVFPCSATRPRRIWSRSSASTTPAATRSSIPRSPARSASSRRFEKTLNRTALPRPSGGGALCERGLRMQFFCWLLKRTFFDGKCGQGWGEKGQKREKSKKQGAGSGWTPHALVLIRVFCQNIIIRPLCSQIRNLLILQKNCIHLNKPRFLLSDFS